MKSLKHGFQQPTGNKELTDVVYMASITSYQKCLLDMFNWIRYKEKNGYIVNADLMVKCIVDTTTDLKWLNTNTGQQIDAILQSIPNNEQ